MRKLRIKQVFSNMYLIQAKFQWPENQYLQPFSFQLVIQHPQLFIVKILIFKNFDCGKKSKQKIKNIGKGALHNVNMNKCRERTIVCCWLWIKGPQWSTFKAWCSSIFIIIFCWYFPIGIWYMARILVYCPVPDCTNCLSFCLRIFTWCSYVFQLEIWYVCVCWGQLAFLSFTSF